MSKHSPLPPDRVRDIFLGFNDGLVELTGATAGFFAAFNQSSTIVTAASAVAVAGALSMAAGAYVAIGSQLEAQGLRKKTHLLTSSTVIGLFYLVGAAVPVLPVLLGARALWTSVLAAGVGIVLVSAILSRLSGMRLRERVFKNLFILALTIAATYGIGLAARSLFGVSV